MKYALILFSTIVINGSAKAHNLSRPQKMHTDSVTMLREVISKSHVISSSNVGFTGAPSNTWYAFAYLAMIGKEDELLKMTYDKNPALRLYAYTALMHKNYAAIDKVKQRLEKDTATVETLSGCIMSRSTVAETLSRTDMWYNKTGIDELSKQFRSNRKYANEVYAALKAGKPVQRAGKTVR